jgi:hypothetical protein
MKTLVAAITLAFLATAAAPALARQAKTKNLKLGIEAVAEGAVSPDAGTGDAVEEAGTEEPAAAPAKAQPAQDVVTVDWNDWKRTHRSWGDEHGRGGHGDEAIVLFGQSKTIAPGEHVDGDIVIMGGSIEIGEGAAVDGDVVCMGGSVTVGPGVSIDGDTVTMGGSIEIGAGTRVDGDVVDMGGMLTIGPDAEIDGDAVNMGGGLEIDPAARVGGQKVRVVGGPNFPLPFEKIARIFSSFDHGSKEPARMGSGLVGRLVDVVKDLIAFAFIAFLGLLFTVFMPRQMNRIDDHLTNAFPRSALLGLAVLVLLPLVTVVFAVTIIGIPLIPLLLLAVVVTALMGYLAFSRVLGRRLAGDRHVMIQIVVGMALLQGAIILGDLVALPGGALATIGHTLCFVGKVAFVGANFVGLGAVVYSRWGRRTLAETSAAQAPNGSGTPRP